MMDEEIYDNFLRDIADIEIFRQFADTHELCGEREFNGKQRFNPLMHLDEQTFQEKYRFSKENASRIIDLVRDDLDIPGDAEVRKHPQVPLELQVLIAIRYWGSTEHPMITAYEHGVSSFTLAKICKRVSAALASKSSYHIRMPARLSEKEAATIQFQTLAGNGSPMQNVIGAVDHHTVIFQKQIEIRKRGMKTEIKPAENKEQIQIQVVSDALCRIRDIECKLRQLNENDDPKEIFTQSHIKERFEQNEFRGRMLLGSERLSCTSYLFTPVDFPITYKEKSYNRTHATTFAPAERCLSLWKQRFHILNNELSSTFVTARNTITALAVLHNLAIDWGDSSLDLESEHKEDCTLVSKSSDVNIRWEFIKSHF